MKKIFLVSHSSEATGGGEDDFERLLKFLNGKYILYTAFPDGPRASLFASLSNKSILIRHNIFPFSGFSFREYSYYVKTSFEDNNKIKKFIEDKEIDVCYINSSAVFLMMLPFIRKKIPVVLSVKEKINPELIRKLIYRFIGKHCCKVILISKYLENLFKLSAVRNNYSVVHSAMESENYLSIKQKLKPGKKSDVLRILNVGVITPMKGQDILLKALRESGVENYQVKFAGRVANRKYYNKLISSENFSKEKYIFLNDISREELIKEMLNCDVVIVTSLEEGQSFVVMESLLLEVPLITSSVGIVPEILKHRKNGLIYQPGNYRELGNLIMYFVSNRIDCLKLFDNSSKIILEKFDLTNCLNFTEEILKSCIKA